MAVDVGLFLTRAHEHLLLYLGLDSSCLAQDWRNIDCRGSHAEGFCKPRRGVVADGIEFESDIARHCQAGLGKQGRDFLGFADMVHDTGQVTTQRRRLAHKIERLHTVGTDIEVATIYAACQIVEVCIAMYQGGRNTIATHHLDYAAHSEGLLLCTEQIYL